MPARTLSPFQRDIARGFFARESRFFLSGGGALVGFHLHHRTTDDLDLFSLTAALEDGLMVVHAVASELGATVEIETNAPEFKRCVVRRGKEAVKIDLVYERAEQWFPEKPEIEGILVDPPQEILANKLCTLLSRGEIRDLVDVFALERRGFKMEEAFPAAMKKDGGLTPAMLGEILDQWRIGFDARIPGDIPARELEAYRRDLVGRLRRMAFPGGGGSSPK